MDVRVVMSAAPLAPNVYVNRHPSAKRLGVQRPKGAGLNMLLGRLAKPDSRSTGRTTREAYHFRLPERDVSARLNTGRMQHKRLEAAWGLHD